MAENRLINKVWQYSLFEAFARRRSHRFALGLELREALFPYKSDKGAVPLSELETALLCWAGHGINGLILADMDISLNNIMGWSGRTHPDGCNDQHTDLLFVNDEGVFLYRPKDATKVVEIETVDDREKIIAMFREGKIKIADGRLGLCPPAISKQNNWNTDKPGQTTFFMIVNITYEYINFLLLSFNNDYYRIIDERTGKPAGLGKWIDNGYLNGPEVPLTVMEMMVLNIVGATAHYMAENINLACTAMGLGGFLWGGFLPLIILGGTPFTRGLGFRFITGKDKMPTPIGKDGYIEALCPPYFKDMDVAVDHVVNMKFGSGGLFSPNFPGTKAWQAPDLITRTSEFREESIDCTKAYCKYVHETYGRFPAVVDAIQIPIAVTAHHLDLDFYERYYPPEAISKEQIEHMELWHKSH